MTFLRCAPSVVVASLLGTTGCATSLATMQPAETLAPGHVQVNAAMAANIPASRIVNAVDVATELGTSYARDPGYRPTTEDQKRMLGAAVGLGLSSPGVNPDLMLRVGILHDLDAGIRWSGLAAHADVKYRFLGGSRVARDGASGPPKEGTPRRFADDVGTDKAGGFQGSLSLGVSKALYSGLVFDVFDFLDIGDYSRWNLEVPLIFGRALGDVGHVWFGPKYVYSHYAVDASLRNVGVVPETSGSFHHLGGFAGVGLGYKVVFVFAELTVAKMWAEPEILGQTIDLGGFVVVPAGGLMLRI